MAQQIDHSVTAIPKITVSRLFQLPIEKAWGLMSNFIVLPSVDPSVVTYAQQDLKPDQVGFIRNIDIGPAIRAAIDSLLPVYRCTVLLVDVDGMTYEEAAEVLGVPTGTVRSRLFRARRLLQQQLLAHARDAGVAGAPSSPSAQTQP